MLLLAGHDAREGVKREDRRAVRTGLLIDIRETSGVRGAAARMMMNTRRTAVLRQRRIPARSLIGDEARGFHYIWTG